MGVLFQHKGMPAFFAGNGFAFLLVPEFLEFFALWTLT